MKIKPFRIKKMISTKSKRGSAKIYDNYCSFKSLSVAQIFLILITEIKINKLTWEKSECSCAVWLKNYKCSHIIAISCRLELCHFITVAMAQPIGMKRRQGRPKNTFPALRHQPQETVNVTNQEITEDEEEIEEEDEPIHVFVRYKPLKMTDSYSINVK